MPLATLNVPRVPLATQADRLAVPLGTHRRWVSAVREMDEEALARPVGPMEGQWADQPFAALVFHLNREVMHHGGEICLLRDLYGARFATT